MQGQQVGVLEGRREAITEDVGRGEICDGEPGAGHALGRVLSDEVAVGTFGCERHGTLGEIQNARHEPLILLCQKRPVVSDGAVLPVQRRDEGGDGGALGQARVRGVCRREQRVVAPLCVSARLGAPGAQPVERGVRLDPREGVDDIGRRHEIPFGSQATLWPR